MKRYQWLENMIKENGYKVGVEVGTGTGRTAMHLMRTCPDLFLIEVAWYPGSITDTDRNSRPQDKARWLMRIAPYRDRIKIISKPSVKAAEKFNRIVDFVFIDADHAKKSVLEDNDSWFPKVRIGGMMCGHDCGHPEFPGVREALEEFYGDNYVSVEEHDWMWYHRKVAFVEESLEQEIVTIGRDDVGTIEID